MKTCLTTLLTICLALMTGSVFAQCPAEDITLNSQQQIDDFALNYPGCTELAIDLIINDDPATPIYNLDGLSNIIATQGVLSIKDNDSLTSLSGLQNLGAINNYLGVENNDNLTTLTGLENASDSIFAIMILDNENLQSLTGLESIDSIEYLEIRDNPNLNSLASLENVTGAGSLYIMGSSNLTSLTGLENLSGLIDLRIANNNNLSSLTGLENLNSAGSVSITGNDNLTSLMSLESLDSLADLTVISNPNLTSLEGIGNINPEFINSMTIFDNINLSDCAVESICQYIIEPENISSILIGANAEGCNSTGEIASGCISFWGYTIEGNIFMDANDDCLRDTSELDLNDWIIKVEGEQSTHYAYTYDNGKYITPVDTGAFTVTAIPPNSLWENTCPEEVIVNITDSNQRDTVDFGASSTTFCPLLEIDITAPFVRRCFDSNYYVRYCNSGTAVAENAYVEVQLDPFFTYQNSTIAGTDLGDNLYSFDLGNVSIGECGSFRIDVYVDCDSTILGQTHCVEAHIFPDSICSPALPLWDESSIRVDAQCLGDSIEFKIENVGTGDMSDSLEYIIVEDDLIFMRAKFQLNSGNNLKLNTPANGAFHRLEAEQSPGHPSNSMPSVFVEGCGTNTNGEISLGFVNYYLLDEGDAFVSIDCQENVGSYDPNDKQAFPVGYGDQHYITDSTDLEYMIRFQNTGTDTAFNIVIRDTLSVYLDIETLRPGVASHPYRYDIEGSNIAIFTFENIMLPDSNVNEVASHGFIKFNIEQQRDNPIGTHIMNDAAIYFDFNELIITNTVLHTIGQDFMGIITSIITPPEVSDASISVNVFPNPFDEYTRFEVQGKAVNELNLSLYDMMGRKVLQQQNTNQSFIKLYKNHLPPGVYVFKLIDEKQQLATGKLVVK